MPKEGATTDIPRRHHQVRPNLHTYIYIYIYIYICAYTYIYIYIYICKLSHPELLKLSSRTCKKMKPPPKLPPPPPPPHPFSASRSNMAWTYLQGGAEMLHRPRGIQTHTSKFWGFTAFHYKDSTNPNTGASCAGLEGILLGNALRRRVPQPTNAFPSWPNNLRESTPLRRPGNLS